MKILKVFMFLRECVCVVCVCVVCVCSCVSLVKEKSRGGGCVASFFFLFFVELRV